VDVPPYSRLLEAISEARKVLSSTDKLVIINDIPEPLVVIGDIHGDLATLQKILRDPDVEDSMSKGLAVFLGDYVDRGPHQVQVIYELLELLLAGSKLLLLRGNHEPPPGLEPIPHDFPIQLASAYGAERGRELYYAFRSLFDDMPYAAVVSRFALLVHGGPPTWALSEGADLIELLKPGRHSLAELLEQLLWNDPSDYVDEYAPSPRGAGFLWGWKVTEAVLSKGKLRLIIRGHEPCDQGYKLNHGGRVVTIFSRLGPPYFNSRAAYLVITSTCIDRITSCVRTI
jgi:protein phosphatase